MIYTMEKWFHTIENWKYNKDIVILASWLVNLIKFNKLD